ncbi:MAG: 30S ribosomal protein S15 [Candidatus Gracilibacteria bacterium]|nr:30S ribosomal protein S15 [Candidatus Gracilibacteria bacterium]
MQRAEKKEIIANFARDKKDTGSPEVQIAILTSRIESLKGHLEEHKKDNHSRRGIMLMVAKRRKLLNYLKKTNNEKYDEILAKLELRK